MRRVREYPFVIHGPGVQRGVKEWEHLFSLLDLPATILDLAGVEVPKHYHGRSLVPFLRGEEVEEWRDEVFIQISESQVGRAVCDGRYKYSVSDPSLNGVRTAVRTIIRKNFSHDLFSDPDENCNLIDDPDYEEVRNCMRRAVIRNIERFERYTPEINRRECHESDHDLV